MVVWEGGMVVFYTKPFKNLKFDLAYEEAAIKNEKLNWNSGHVIRKSVEEKRFLLSYFAHK